MDEIKTITTQIMDYIGELDRGLSRARGRLEWLNSWRPDEAIDIHIKLLGAKEMRRAIVFGAIPYAMSTMLVPDLVAALNHFMTHEPHWKVKGVCADGYKTVYIDIVYEYQLNGEMYPGIVISLSEDKSLRPPKVEEEGDDEEEGDNNE